MVDLVLHDGKITSLDPKRPEVSAVAIADGRTVASGTDAEVLAKREAKTRVIDLQKRRVIPGLNDSHIHPIRGGLNFNMELRWDGVPSLGDALRGGIELATRSALAGLQDGLVMSARPAAKGLFQLRSARLRSAHTPHPEERNSRRLPPRAVRLWHRLSDDGLGSYNPSST